MRAPSPPPRVLDRSPRGVGVQQSTAPVPVTANTTPYARTVYHLYYMFRPRAPATVRHTVQDHKKTRRGGGLPSAATLQRHNYLLLATRQVSVHTHIPHLHLSKCNRLCGRHLCFIATIRSRSVRQPAALTQPFHGTPYAGYGIATSAGGQGPGTPLCWQNAFAFQ